MNSGDEYKPTEYFPQTPGQGGDAFGGQGWPGISPSMGGQAKTEVLRPSGPKIFAMLIIVDGPGIGQVYRLNPSEATTIGRDYNCDIVVDEAAVSRQHAKVKLEKKEGGELQFFIQDLATDNGIEVNGQNVIKHYLEDGDQLKLGRAVLVFKQVMGNTT